MFAPQLTLHEIFGWALKKALLMKLGAGGEIRAFMGDQSPETQDEIQDICVSLVSVLRMSRDGPKEPENINISEKNLSFLCFCSRYLPQPSNHN